jgi:hypothetical protein
VPRGPSAVTTRVVGPARYFIVVDSFAVAPVAPANAFTLTVSLTSAGTAGSACTPSQPGQTDRCASGLLCPPSAGTSATCVAPSAPVIDAVELFPQPGQAATETTLFLSAQDADGDWASLGVVFLDGAGAPLDAGQIDLTEYWGEALLVELPIPLTLPAGTRSVDVTVTDSTTRSSVRTRATLTPWSTLGQTCNGTLTAPDPCQGELVCAATTCSVSAAATTACAQATTTVLGAATTGTAADLTADTFEGSCHLDRGGHDRIYRAVLPALATGAVGWDLVVSSANAGVAWDYRTQLDTYLYVRADCADPATEVACNDDVGLTDLRSQLVATNLLPGTYYVYLDTSSASQNGTALGYALVVRARAVLKAGSTCDPTGENDRCQGEACLMGTCP